MATRASHNKNSSAVKRIMTEARELQNDDSTEYSAGPLEQDIFEWHCTIRGPADTEFEGGLYHCRIILPSEYPFKAPSIMVLTPNGRFELNKKICISFTSYHEELWQPAWGVRTAIVGLQGFFPLKGEAAVGVGAVEYPITERKRLAALSRSWTCPDCGQPNIELLPDALPRASCSAGTVDPPLPGVETTAEPPHRSLASSSIPPSFAPPIPDANHASPSQTVLQDVGLSPVFVNTTPDMPTEAVLPVPEVLEQLQPVPTAVRSGPKPRPPIWLDGAIAFFCLVIAFVAGRRVSFLWQFVTDHV